MKPLKHVAIIMMAMGDGVLVNANQEIMVTKGIETVEKIITAAIKNIKYLTLFVLN